MSSRWILAAFVTAMLSAAFVTGCNESKPAEPVAPKTADTPKADDKAPKADDKKTADAPKAPSTGPVAKVNGTEISREAYNAELDNLRKRFAMFGGNIPEAQLARFKQRIIDRMVEDELIRQRLDKEKVAVPADAIQKELDEYKARTPGGADKFEDFLKKTGKTVDDLKTDIQKRLALKAFLDKEGALKVTDAEVTEYFEKNKKRFEVKERVKAAHILVKVGKDDDAAKKAEAKKKIDAIYKEATKAGADFEALAKAKSEGPSAPRGGDLGWFTRGRMVKEFETAAFSMKPGQVSKPLETKFGYHVLKLYEREDAGEKKFDDVKEDIVKRLEARKFREQRQQFLKSLRTEGKVEVLEKIEIPKPNPASAPGGLVTPVTPKKIEVRKPGQEGNAPTPKKIEVKQPIKKAPAPVKKAPAPAKKAPAKPSSAPASK